MSACDPDGGHHRNACPCGRGYVWSSPSTLPSPNLHERLRARPSLRLRPPRIRLQSHRHRRLRKRSWLPEGAKKPARPLNTVWDGLPGGLRRCLSRRRNPARCSVLLTSWRASCGGTLFRRRSRVPYLFHFGLGGERHRAGAHQRGYPSSRGLSGTMRAIRRRSRSGRDERPLARAQRGSADLTVRCRCVRRSSVRQWERSGCLGGTLFLYGATFLFGLTGPDGLL
jgi:hypothetical protein